MTITLRMRSGLDRVNRTYRWNGRQFRLGERQRFLGATWNVKALGREGFELVVHLAAA